jgi:hypothetical protein
MTQVSYPGGSKIIYNDEIADQHVYVDDLDVLLSKLQNTFVVKSFSDLMLSMKIDIQVGRRFKLIYDPKKYIDFNSKHMYEMLMLAYQKFNDQYYKDAAEMFGYHMPRVRYIVDSSEGLHYESGAYISCIGEQITDIVYHDKYRFAIKTGPNLWLYHVGNGAFEWLADTRSQKFVIYINDQMIRIATIDMYRDYYYATNKIMSEVYSDRNVFAVNNTYIAFRYTNETSGIRIMNLNTREYIAKYEGGYSEFLFIGTDIFVRSTKNGVYVVNLVDMKECYMETYVYHIYASDQELILHQHDLVSVYDLNMKLKFYITISYPCVLVIGRKLYISKNIVIDLDDLVVAYVDKIRYEVEV